MALCIEIIRGTHWRPKRLPGGEPLLCETTREAADALLATIAEGRIVARATNGPSVVLLACLNHDGSVTIGGRHGMSRARLPVSD